MIKVSSSKQTNQLFELAVDEEFEDGFESPFSRSLVSFI
jgi:hypothetical protein